MKKFFIVLVFSVLYTVSFSQNNLLWKGYPSFNEIRDISQSSTKVFTASQNAILSKNISTNDARIRNTVDGLSGQTISTIYYSSVFNKTLVGYENGLIIVINESDGRMFNAVGIIQKAIPSNIKKINNFYENNGIVYISCDFGIVQFNLNTNEFGDTYFLGNTVSNYIAVVQTTVLNNSIYAVTQGSGIKIGDLSNPNLNDFSQWNIFNAGFSVGIATINNQIVAAYSNNTIYKFAGNVPTLFYTAFQPIVDFRVFQDNLICSTASKVVIFNNSLFVTNQVDSSSIAVPVQFTCATQVNNSIFIGTLENGIYSTTTSNTSVLENQTPNGPIRNVVFGLTASPNNLYAVYGGYDGGYNPYSYNNFGGPNQYGFSRFVNNYWDNKPYSSVLGAKALSKITVNPNNKNQVYISSYFSGLLKVESGTPTILYDQNNSTLQQAIDSPLPPPSFIDDRVNGAAFDKTGNLWVSNSLNPKLLHVLKTNGTWQGITIPGIITPAFNNVGNIIIDKNNTKWFPTSNNGVVGYNENGNVTKIIYQGADVGNLPNVDARVVALDNKNQLWIGTISGLRVVPNIDSFLSAGQIKSNSIIILEENLAQELFFEQSITDIVVDGANRKWVATENSGVFLVSPNGQKTIYRFTETNSPLPSNSVLDVDIDPETGEVFFATSKGMVSFRGVSTKASTDLENVYIYPNPVRPEFTDTVKISGLLDKATVKITDIEGGLVYETTSEGGTIEWDTTAFGKYKVASGVYMVFISAQDGVETKVKKVMIIR
jgi:hypothetical protein